MTNTERWINRVDQLIEKGRTAKSSIRHHSGSFSYSTVDNALHMEFRTASLSFLQQVYGSAHPYYLGIHQHPSHSDIDYGLGVLNAVRDEMLGGWLETMRGLVTAELFSDFLEMADHLVEQR